VHLDSFQRKTKLCRTTVSDNCDTTVNDNQGCGVDFDSILSYGEAFNLDAGGYYVTSRSRDCGIQIWFWPRDSPGVPAEIAQGGGEALSPDPTWGEPAAAFPMDPGYCNYDQYFNEHEIIFDLTFCVGGFLLALYFFLTTTEVLPSLG
jgi:hypothetical protein